MKYAAIAVAALLAFAAPALADDAPANDPAPGAASDSGQDKSAASDAKADDLGSFSIPAADGDSSAKDKAPADSKK